MSPFLFIVGCARSGTTLLGRIVGAHPQLAITPSLHWIVGQLHRQKVRRAGDSVPHELVEQLVADRRFARFGISPEALQRPARPEGVPYRALLERIFDLYRRAEGKPLVGNKTAPFVRRIAHLHEMWPRARFVHVIRDGRDVCLSVLGWPSADGIAERYATWAEDPVSTIALWWKRKVLLGREGGRQIPSGQYRELHYESLVAQPDRGCRELCAFLEVPFDDAMLGFHRRRSRNRDLERDHPTMPITPGLRDWRTQMTADDVARFEAAAGPLLETLGYERAVRRPGSRALRRAAELQRRFEEDLRVRGSSQRGA